MRRALLVAAFMLFAIPAVASENGTQVDRECDQTTITNTADIAQTYHVQVYEAADDYTLEPGGSHMFESVDHGGHWAVWTGGELVAFGEFCNVLDDNGKMVPVADYRPDPTPVVDGADEPVEVVEQAPQMQTTGMFRPV